MWGGFRGTIVVFVFVLLLLLIPFRRRKKKRRGFYLATAQVEAVECQEKDTDDPQGRKMPQYRAVLELYGLAGQKRQNDKKDRKRNNQSQDNHSPVSFFPGAFQKLSADSYIAEKIQKRQC